MGKIRNPHPTASYTTALDRIFHLPDGYPEAEPRPRDGVGTG
jgi:hypothetical protein